MRAVVFTLVSAGSRSWTDRGLTAAGLGDRRAEASWPHGLHERVHGMARIEAVLTAD